MNFKFQVLEKDVLLYDVMYFESKPYITAVNRDFIIEPFLVRMNSEEQIMKFFESRAVPQNRPCASKIALDQVGYIGEYNPYLICRTTNGVLYEDFYWIRFWDRMNLTYKDVKVR